MSIFALLSMSLAPWIFNLDNTLIYSLTIINSLYTKNSISMSRSNEAVVNKINTQIFSVTGEYKSFFHVLLNDLEETFRMKKINIRVWSSGDVFHCYGRVSSLDFIITSIHLSICLFNQNQPDFIICRTRKHWLIIFINYYPVIYYYPFPTSTFIQPYCVTTFFVYSLIFE